MAIRRIEGKRGVTWELNWYEPGGKQKTRRFKKKKDAVAEEGKIRSLIAEGRYLDIKPDYPTTLGQLIDEYTVHFGHQPSYKSWKTYVLDRFKQSMGEDTRIASIKYVDLERYKVDISQKLTKNGGVRQPSTINKELSAIHHMFQKAVEWEMLDINPFDRGGSYLLKCDNQRLRYLSEEEIFRLLDVCPKHLGWIVECALNTGMRQGEILNLQWSQIRGGFIYLDGSMTKNGKPRQIPINERMSEVFREILAHRQLKSPYVFTYAKSEDKLVGTKPVRNPKKLTPAPQRINSIKTSFRSAVKAAEIEDFRFHDLRHTFASHMIMRGASLKNVQEILGHETLDMTLRYAHLSQEHKQQAVQLLNGLTDVSKSTIRETLEN